MNQIDIEEYFSKSKSREYVLGLLLSDEGGVEVIENGINLLQAWCILPSNNEKKEQRRATLHKMDIAKVVHRVFTDILLMDRPSTIANMATTLGTSLGFQEAKQGITLAGEIIAVLSHAGIFTLTRKAKGDSYYVYPNITLNDDQYEIAHRGMYLPPCVERPRQLKHNRSTPDKTIKGESLILGGQHNYHDYSISHDVLNKQNNIALTLNLDFLNAHEEQASYDLDYIKGMESMPVIVAKEMLRLHKRNWEMHKEQSYHVYELMCESHNKFYIPNKVDKRGRIYAQGHHINPMGTSFKKASIDLFNKEQVEVPEGYFQ